MTRNWKLKKQGRRQWFSTGSNADGICLRFFFILCLLSSCALLSNDLESNPVLANMS